MRSSKILAAVLVLATWAGLGSSAFAAPTIDLLTDMAFTNGAAGAVEVQPILITEDGSDFTTASDIRLIIPAAYNMTWDSADTSMEILMSGTGTVSATVSSYQNANKTCQAHVTTNFAAGDKLVITGLSFRGWGAEQTAGTLGVAWNGTNVAQANSTQGFTTGGVKLSSANNFSFKTNDTTPTLPNIAITDSTAAPLITAASGIRIGMPHPGAIYGTNPTWDTTMTSFTVSGAAAAKVSTTLTGASFQNSNYTLVITVTSNFAAGEAVTISGLRMATPAGSHTADALELVVDGVNAYAVGDIVAIDDKTFAIGPPSITMAAVNTVSANAANQAVGLITLTDTSGIITAVSDIRLMIMSTTSTGGANTGRDNLSWTAPITPSYAQPTTGVVAAGVVNGADTGNGAGKRMLGINVTTSFAAGDVLGISGLQINNSTATATKLYVGLIVSGYTADTVTGAFGRVQGMVTEQNATGSGPSPTNRRGGGGCFLGTAQRPASQ